MFRPVYHIFKARQRCKCRKTIAIVTSILFLYRCRLNLAEKFKSHGPALCNSESGDETRKVGYVVTGGFWGEKIDKVLRVFLLYYLSEKFFLAMANKGSLPVSPVTCSLAIIARFQYLDIASDKNHSFSVLYIFFPHSCIFDTRYFSLIALLTCNHIFSHSVSRDRLYDDNHCVGDLSSISALHRYNQKRR